MELVLEIKELPPQPVAKIQSRVQMEELNGLLVEASRKLFRYLDAQGVYPTGPPFVLYYDSVGHEGIDVEVCVPTPALLSGEGEVDSVELPGGEFATTVHVGPPGQIGGAYRALARWVRNKGYWLSGPFREVQLASFGKVNESPQTVTEIFLPIEKAA